MLPRKPPAIDRNCRYQRPCKSTIYSVSPLASCLRYSKLTSIQMTRHRMVGGYLFKLWLNLGALLHGEWATWMEGGNQLVD